MGILMDIAINGSKLWVVNFYQEQLNKFVKLGIGNKTENGIEVTEKLIRITQERLAKLSVVYDAKLTYNAHKTRSDKLKTAMKRRQLGAKQIKTNSNGTVITPRVQNNGNSGHEGGE